MTDPDRKLFQRARALFDEAIELPAAERPDFLKARCEGDERLLAEVEGLLAATDEDPSLDVVVGRMAETLASETPDRLLQQKIGNYRLVQVIGEGGMGSVYLGERADEQFRHRVAIKILRPGRTDADLIQRFRVERQVLATLDHPNIARLLDGGETEDGLPFVVMEYVDGEPIDEHCDARQLDIVQRLRLFQKVCDAVDYAHRSLVVHRDIKPSNILVDPNGEPKLLDFGIAKFLDEAALGGGMAVTRAGGALMTPQFASPEQLSGEPVTTATDIYSMGVLLYKLMCGRMPYRIGSGLPTELARAILEEEPSRPSTVLTTPLDQSEEDPGDVVSDRRGMSLRSLKNVLRGDLDNLVLMALRKEPGRRYLSVGAFSADIDNYLAHRPVNARPDSLVYRSRKFLRRHRIGAIATAVMAVLLVASVLQIIEQRNRATVAATQANQTTAFLAELFESASPAAEQGEIVTARDLLTEGVTEIERLDEQPAVQARLLHIMGNSYGWIGDQEQARRLLTRSLAIRETRLPFDAIAIAENTTDLGDVLRLQDELEAALEHFGRSLALYEEAYGPNSGALAYVLGRIGDVQRIQGRSAEARVTLEKAVAMKQALGESDDHDDIDIRGNLALVLDSLGRHSEAATLQSVVVDASRRLEGDRHPNTVIRIANLGLILDRQGKFDESLNNLDEAYDYVQEIWPDNARQRAWIAIAKAGTLRSLGRFDEARLLHEQAVTLALESAGPESVTYARRLRSLAYLHLDQADYTEAVEVLGRSLRAMGTAGADFGREVAFTRLQLVPAYLGTGRLAQAEVIARELIAQPDLLGPVSTAAAHRDLGDALSRQGLYAEAESSIVAAVTSREQLGGPETPAMLRYLSTAAAHFRRSGDAERAVSYGRRAYDIGETLSPPGTWLAAQATARYGQSLLAAGDEAAAERHLRAAHEVLGETFGEDDPRVREVALALARMANTK